MPLTWVCPANQGLDRSGSITGVGVWRQDAIAAMEEVAKLHIAFRKSLKRRAP